MTLPRALSRRSALPDFLLSLIALASIALNAPAQVASSRAFDVASIKPTPPDFMGSRAFAPVSGNNLVLQGMSLKALIHLAYDLPPDLIGGGPAWVDDARYDVDAKADGPASQKERLEMLQTLLTGRFHLAFHYETKQALHFELSLGKNGSGLRERHPGDGGEPSGIRDLGRLHYVCRDTSIAFFVKYLEGTVLSRPVADKTGLTGTYDFELSWRPDDTQFGGRFAGSPEAESDLPDLFAALKNIGLRLEPVKSPVQFLRIDSAERPTEN